MKKIIKALASISMIGFVLSQGHPAFARFIWFNHISKANDGSVLGIRTDGAGQTIIKREGWTFFKYIIKYSDDQIEEFNRDAGTPFCYRGQVQLNPKATNVVLSAFNGNPGWIADRTDEMPPGVQRYVIVQADSEQSRLLLKTICKMAE